MSQDSQTLQDDGISATIVAQGAELVSLQDAQGFEFLWQAGPEWRRHSPVLFPIVGRLKGDRLRHRGQVYPMTQHGFARDRRFSGRGPRSCSLVLTDDGIAARIILRIRLRDLHAERQLGALRHYQHWRRDAAGVDRGAPAFNWPLLPDLAKTDYQLTFASAEPAPVHA